MALFKSKSPEDLQAEADREAEEMARRAEERTRKAELEFLKSPVGKARAAFKGGHHVFQFSMDVMNLQQRIVIGWGVKERVTGDPVEVLNAVAKEGWDLVNGSFVFVQRDQVRVTHVLNGGQTHAFEGTVQAYYLFKRRPGGDASEVDRGEEKEQSA